VHFKYIASRMFARRGEHIWIYPRIKYCWTLDNSFLDYNRKSN